MVIHAEKIVLAVVIMLSVVARYSHSLGFRSQRLRMKAEESFASFGIFRQVKRMKATAGTEVEGETVRLISGEEAKIIARGRAGWISVQSLRTNEILKIRRSDIQSSEPATPSSTTIIPTEETSTASAECRIDVFPPLAEICPPLRHQQCSSWIIFSDLHVKASSIATCEQVLAEVHRSALQRNAGIIFLGDFWHVRGALSVDLLNRVLKSLQEWTQPVIMIPGNHDQVTLGGKVHALEPLKYAFKNGQILMIDEPCICMNALWIPYRRSHSLMKHILSEAWHNPSISAIFCHADVKGAWMNDGMQSREGIDVQLFPPNVPIFSGHFHKPHSVAFSLQSLRYVGSPYQTSLSEADQAKYLYEVSLLQPEPGHERRNWKETSRWPLLVGKRYYKVKFANIGTKIDLLQEGDTLVLLAELQEQHEADALARQLRDKGIEVEVREIQADKLFTKSLLNNAVMLDAIDPVAAADGGSGGSEVVNMAATADQAALHGRNEVDEVLSVGLDHMSPMSLFDSYMANVDLGQFQTKVNLTTENPNGGVPMDGNAQVAQDIKAKVISEGKQVIERLLDQRRQDSEHQGGGTETMAVLNADHRHLVLDSIQLRNFGPYGGAPVQYPLSNRGLVLLRGQAMDKTGADSNGSGKTTLAMSILWALTGSMDTRLINEGRSYDVSFDAAPTTTTPTSKRQAALARKTAEVSLRGHINGKAFEIIRRKSSKKQELFFYVDQDDKTNQAVKDTQAVIDAWLGLDRGVLQRCFFFGQHSHTAQSLLGLTDTRIKEELGPLINIDIWSACTADTRSRDKVLKQQLNEVNMTLRYMTQQELPKLQTQIQQHETAVRSLQDELQGLLQLRSSGGGLPGMTVNGSSAASSSMTAMSSLPKLQEEMMELEMKINRFEAQRVALQNEKISQLRKQLMDAMQEQRSAMGNVRPSSLAASAKPQISLNQQLQQAQMKVSRSKAALEITQNAMQKVTKRLQQELPSQIDHLETRMQALISSNDLLATVVKAYFPPSSTVDTANCHQGGPPLASLVDEFFTDQLNVSISQVAALDEQIRTINGTLQRLAAHGSSPLPPVAASTVDAHHHHLHHDPDLCPTCNQTFPAASRTQRQQTLRQELQGHLKTRVQWLRDQRSLQTQHEAGKALIDLERQRNAWQQEILDFTRQYEALINDQRRYEDEVRNEQALIETLQQAERDEHERFQQVIHTLQSNLTEAEKEASLLDHELRTARQQLQQRQQQYTRWKDQEGQFNVRMGIVEEKLRLTNQTWFQLREQEAQLQQQQARLEEQRRQLVDDATVLSYLSDFFGPKGIQHFVFQSVIDRLEYLANTYLEILANDGIRLQLRSDVDAEKILKYVLIRQNQDVVDGTAVDALDGTVTTEVASTGRKKKSMSASSSSSSSSLPVEGSSSSGVLSSANVTIPIGFRERGLAQLSGGQWRRVSLALDFAFTELVIRRGLLKCNVLVLDEILTHLDGQGREAVGTVLKAMIDRTAQAPSTTSDQPIVPVFGGGFETIIVILQDLVANEIEEAFDHIDIVRKDGDVSRVIVDK